MCQVFGEHWGYAENDFNYKSLANIIEDLCVCRRFGANFLLNVGPMGNGLLRPLDRVMMEEIGRWVKINEEAIYLPRPYKTEILNKASDFLLEKDGVYYLFCHKLSMSVAPDVAISKEVEYTDVFKFDKKIKSVVCFSVAPAYRGCGIAGKLLNMAVEDLRSKGISPAYLVTDHTGFYERYGWEFLCMVQGDGEPEMTRMYIHR